MQPMVRRSGLLMPIAMLPGGGGGADRLPRLGVVWIIAAHSREMQMGDATSVVASRMEWTSLPNVTNPKVALVNPFGKIFSHFEAERSALISNLCVSQFFSLFILHWE